MLLQFLGWLLAGPLLLAACLIVYGFHPIQRWRYRKFPGPRPRWLIGNLLEIHAEGQEGAAERWAAEFGPLFLIWLGGFPVLMTADPSLAKKVLARPARHKIWILHEGPEKDYEDHTLFFANGEHWRASRAAWQPFFSRQSLQGHATFMVRSADALCALLGSAAGTAQQVDVWRSLQSLTLDVVGRTAFGVDFNTLAAADSQEGAEADAAAEPAPAAEPAAAGKGGLRARSLCSASTDALLRAVRTVFEVCGPAQPLFGLCFIFPEAESLVRWLVNRWPNAIFRRELGAREVVKAVGAELLQLSRQADAAAPTANGKDGQQQQQQQQQADGNSGKQPPQQAGQQEGQGGGLGGGRPPAVDSGSFLANVGRHTGKTIEGGVLLDDAWATNQATTFLVAGYETTANAITFAVYLLARNPDKEDKLLAEIDAFGRERVPTLDDVEAHFPYASAVLKESMRLYPPSITLMREAPASGPWQLGSYDVPSGTALQVSMHAMQRSPDLWPQPLAFLPERFVAGSPEAEEVMPGAFIPFGAGSRMCVGMRFAELTARLTLIRLYQQFTFRLVPGQVPLKTKVLITQGPIEGVHVTVHRR